MQDIEREILEILKGLESDLPLNQLAEMRQLTEAGEPGIAFENLCTQLYENDVSVAPAVLQQLTGIGEAMGIETTYWELLRKN